MGWGGVTDELVGTGTVNWYLLHLVNSFTGVPNNVFVLISAYFLCKSSFKLRKFLQLWVTIIFYSVGLYILMVAIGESTFSSTELIKRCLVITWTRYWFMTAYLLMYLTVPLLNILVQGMNRQQHKFCCVASFVVFSLVPQITLFGHDFSGVNNGRSYLWFLVVYIWGAYFRLYVPEKVKYQKWMLPIWAACCLLQAFVYFTDVRFHYFFGNSIFVPINSVISVISSLCFFQFWRGVEIAHKGAVKMIQAITPLVFSIYLIHMQSDFVPVLWKWCRIQELASTVFMLPNVIVSIIVVFIGCCVVERIRIELFRATKITAIVNHIGDRIQAEMERRWLSQ